MPFSFLNSSTIQSIMRWSKLSPPRWVSPLVDFTSTTPSPTSRIGDIERAAAEIVDRDGLVGFLIQAVSQRRRRRLIDDAQHVQPGDLAGVLRSLALRVVEIGGHRDHGLGDFLTQIGFRGFLQLGQDHRRDLRGRHRLALYVHAHVAIVAAAQPYRAPSSSLPRLHQSGGP